MESSSIKQPVSSVIDRESQDYYVSMQNQILGNINRFDKGNEQWCLPPHFWRRAHFMMRMKVFPLGIQCNLPIRKCHTNTLSVMDSTPEPLEYCTGYAYDEVTKTWNRHSWAVHRGDSILLETTPTLFKEYYGVELTHIELEQFKEMMEWKK